MPRRVRKSKRRRSTLTPDERFELEIGPNVLRRGGLRVEAIDGVEFASVFASDDARRRAWLLHRPVLLATTPSHAALPWAWHRYEGGDPPAEVPELEAVEWPPVAGEVVDDDALFGAGPFDDESHHGAT